MKWPVFRRNEPQQEGERKTGRKGFGLLFNLLLVFAVLFAVHAWQTRDAVEGVAPDIRGHTLNGPRFELENTRGKPVLVHFWATWCPICGLEEDAIDAIAEDHQVITIAIQSGGADAVWRYMNKEGLRFPVINDEDGRLARTYGVRGVPTTFILNPEGEIEFTEVGLSTGPVLRAKLWMAGSLLAGG